MISFEGIVIGSIEYKEKSKIVELYTPFGRENILARGASNLKSKTLVFTTTLNYVAYDKTKADFPVLIDYELKKSYYSALDTINKAQVVSVIMQVIRALPFDAPHRRIFPFLVKCLDLLEESNPLYVLSVFLIKMLAVFGVQPCIKSCVICGKNEIVNFSLAEGGALCSDHAAYNEGQVKLLEVLRYLYYDKAYIEKTDIDYKDVLDVIYSYYLRHVNIKLGDYKIKLNKA